MAAMSTDTTDLDGYWHELFSAALLGTDRRLPPTAPPGPIAELLVELPPPDVASGLLDQVAAAAALRRAGAAPLRSMAALQPPPTDLRPQVPAAAADRLRHLLDSWPVLEAEWLQAVIDGGWRLGPDTAVALLRRHRTEPAVRELVERAAGPLAAWVVAQVPSLAPAKRASSNVASDDLRPPLVGVPEELVAALGGPVDDIAATLALRFRLHRLTPGDRAPLVAFLVHVPVVVLADVAATLHAVYTDAAGTMLAAYLADLATTRHQMILDLAPHPPIASPPHPPATSPIGDRP
jgi:hypothetical protein